MRRSATEAGLAALLLVLLGGAWLGRSNPPAGAHSDVHALPGKETAAPEIAHLTDEGIRFFASREFPLACQRFTDAFEREPDSAVLRGNLARCFGGWGWQALRDGRADEAMLLFRQGLRQSPEGEDLLKGLGVAAIHAGRTELAFEPLETVLRGTLDADVALLLARLYDQRDDAVRAVAHLKRLLAVDPWHREASRLLDKLERERAIESGFGKGETAHFTVKYHGEREPDARMVLMTLEDLYSRLGAGLGHHPAERILVILYPEERFREITGVHDWVSGLFDGKIRLPSGTRGMTREALERLLAHEYTHAVVHQIARGRAPRWLHEGLAQHFEGIADEDLLSLPRGLTLAGVEALLADGDVAKARTGYRTALWLVRDLLERGGMPLVADLLSRVGRGEKAAAAIQSVYGLTLDELETQWRRVLGASGPHEGELASR